MRVLTAMTVCTMAASLCGGEAPDPRAHLFDTRAPSPTPLTAQALARRAGWALVPEDNTKHQFRGDAVFFNDKLAVVVRPTGRGAEVYSRTAGGLKHRATVGHVAMFSSWLDPIEKLSIVDNSPAAVMLEATFRTGQPASLRLRLTAGEGILEIRPGGAAHSVQALTRARYVVVPDFFADDLVFDPKKWAGAYLPAENTFLGLLDGGDAIVMCVWESSRQDVTIARAGAGKQGELCLSGIRCRKGKRVWLAFLEGAGIWHGAERRFDPMSDKGGWTPPFDARWRCSLVKRAPLAASWDAAEGPRINQVSGRNEGPCLVYPIDRTRATPLTVTCPTDILRSTLGVGPCQYILDAERLAAEATPDQVMDWLERELKRRRRRVSPDEIDERLAQMTDHVHRVRVRIIRYAELSSRVLEICRSEGPRRTDARLDDDLAMTADWLGSIVKRGLVAAGPADRLAKLTQQVQAVVGKEDAAAQCEPLAAEIRGIGDAQTRALSRCRMAARWLQQQSRNAALRHPEVADLAKKIEQETQAALHPEGDPR